MPFWNAEAAAFGKGLWNRKFAGTKKIRRKRVWMQIVKLAVNEVIQNNTNLHIIEFCLLKKMKITIK